MWSRHFTSQVEYGLTVANILFDQCWESLCKQKQLLNKSSYANVNLVRV